ncbi:dicarboxylate/amino acid:cation symporter [Jeotgalibacillus marinus]|uniref:Dicarboxylate/amino acid:cation symporter n=1 Tax=Jeotgalibacillus marinus TaxID=86667 RepID=A0ABV3Q4C1_9BACL
MKMNFMFLIVVSFVMALVVGIILGENATFFQPLGDLFLRLIMFIVVPLILSTIIVGITSAGNIKKLSRLGGKTILYYLGTSFVAIVIGLGAAFIFSPGTDTGITLDTEEFTATETTSFVSTLLNIIPTNPIEALSSGAILQVIFLAIFIGVGIISAGEKASTVQKFFEGLAEVMYKITGIVMKLVPIGIFGLLAPIVGTYGMSVLLPLLKVILAMVVASAFHVLIIYSIAVKTLGKMSPIKFLKGIYPAGIVAFTTASSSGTLPVTLKNTQENLGVSKETSSFVLPLGSTINMDGTAIYLGITVMFIAQYFGIDLTFTQLLTVALVATLSSIGAAGVPGAGLVMLTMVLASVNLPLEGIALVAGVDRILDMFRTSVNVVGDASACVVVDHSERTTNVVLDNKQSVS